MQTRVNKARVAMFLLVGLALCAGTVLGQVITATIYGVVTDPSGAAIPGAAVTVTSEDSGATVAVISGAAGEFTAGSLQPGRYAIQIEAQGFSTQRQRGLLLAGGQTVRLTFALALGTVATTVEVTSETPLLNTVAAEQRTNVESQQLRELPVAHRDWTNLLNLSAGVNTSGSGTVSLNGLAPASFRITVDGTDSASDTELPSLSMCQNFNFIKGVSTEAVEEVNVA